MRLKLDENFGRRCVDLFLAAGHDVTTVVSQGMCGCDDHRLIDTVTAEDRVLVTLDLDFANPLRFDPKEYGGIAVLRLPRRPVEADLIDAAGMLCKHLDAADIVRKLWIVERDRVREYQPDR